MVRLMNERAASSSYAFTCIVVYIAEAHAIDEWPISSGRYNQGEIVSVRQTLTIEAREKVAREFYDRFGYLESLQKNESVSWRLMVARPEIELSVPSFESLYKPWPFRAFGFVEDKIDFVAEPHACEIRIEDIRRWLQNYL